MILSCSPLSASPCGFLPREGTYLVPVLEAARVADIDTCGTTLIAFVVNGALWTLERGCGITCYVTITTFMNYLIISIARCPPSQIMPRWSSSSQTLICEYGDSEILVPTGDSNCAYRSDIIGAMISDEVGCGNGLIRRPVPLRWRPETAASLLRYVVPKLGTSSLLD